MLWLMLNKLAGKNTLQQVDDATPILIEAFTYDNCANQLTAGTTRHYR